MLFYSGLQAIVLVAAANAAILPRQANGSSYAVQTPPLDTDWTYEVGTNPWPEYPRPQLERSQWKNLNGIWRYQNASGTDAVDNPPFGQTFEREVLVPSCLESGLSGIQGSWMLYSWFSTSFDVPSDWTGERTHLNFGAVDYEAWVYVNGQYAGFNRGGYFHFTVDVTDHLSTNGTNELLVFVHDPTDSDDNVIPIGKQTLNPSHIFYRPCSGIWQSVWIESAPANHITELQLSAGADGTVNATVHTSNNGTADVEIKIFNSDGSELASCSGSSNTALTFHAESPELWSPDSPKLYNVTVTIGDDVVSSYTAFRTVSRGEVNGIQRPLLNGEFVFQFGTLDQGYWPDGLYTPPNREAMEFDLKMLKGLGFNMLRKHIKVETALFYQSCDQLGLMLIQDMPSLRPSQTRTLDNCTVETILPNAEQQQEFQRQLELLITQHRSYPSIVTWVIYNEGWGQIVDGEYPEFALTDIVRSLDPTRLVDATSGWFDHGAGDLNDNHHYPYAQCGTPFYSIQSTPYDPSRIAFQGEFGGLGENTTIDHLWNVQQAIDSINQTYEIEQTNEAYNYRSHELLAQLSDQVDKFACSGGVWTQTTDVEGEVNGLLTYDRRVLRPDAEQWRVDIQALYDAAARRGGSNATMAIAEQEQGLEQFGHCEEDFC